MHGAVAIALPAGALVPAAAVAGAGAVTAALLCIRIGLAAALAVAAVAKLADREGAREGLEGFRTHRALGLDAVPAAVPVSAGGLVRGAPAFGPYAVRALGVPA